MATLEYDMGTPLGPDPRAVADLQAIDEYVRTQARPRVEKYPKSLPVVEDYERWRQSVSWWDMNVMTNDTMRTAKAKRDAINVAQDQKLPPGSTVEEGSFVSSPPDVDKEKREQQAAMFGWKMLAVGGAVGFGAYAAWRVFGRKA